MNCSKANVIEKKIAKLFLPTDLGKIVSRNICVGRKYVFILPVAKYVCMYIHTYIWI